ncbi:unnamed protein product [Arctia plantaginis]|uniref:Uncharacterized protein n=1 Tax=Arctia plantaginis TaxID=874455 RepID=A0A8S0Z4R0_ARCPL|nr:unnamed protein product [Arctia plantaginis]
MRRFCTTVFVLVLIHTTLCNVVSVAKDTSLVGDEGDVAVPVENVQSLANEVKATDESTCAKVGEFCMGPEGCCSKACLGFLKRCVSGRKGDIDEE